MICETVVLPNEKKNYLVNKAINCPFFIDIHDIRIKLRRQKFILTYKDCQLKGPKQMPQNLFYSLLMQYGFR